MFTDIDDYMCQTREERRAHLMLDSACIEIGGHASTVFKGLLAHHLMTTIPTNKKVYLCHACNNAKCSNVFHLYWGTPRDNYLDSEEAFFGNRNHERNSPKALAHAKELGKKFGGRNKFSTKEVDQIVQVISDEPKVWGWKQKASKKLGVTATQLNRYIRNYNVSIV